MCTALRIKTKGGDSIIARTMDLNIDLESKLLVFGRGMTITSRAPGDMPGMEWNVKYGFVGLNGKGVQTVSDGVNEAGLYFGSLYLPGFTKYQEVESGQANISLAPIDVGMYLLSNAANVSEAKELIKKVLVWEEVTKEVGFTFPLHYLVQDKDGSAAVIEYVGGQLKIHDNALGVLTNSPTFDWHLINLANFVNLSPYDALGKNLNGVGVKALGEGSGMLGLPGDFTPPSRFVRAVVLSQSAFVAETTDDGVVNASHIINNFDLVHGVERDENDKKEACDYTQWTTLTDLTNLDYYIRMHDSPIFVKCSLKDMDLSKAEVATIDPNHKDWYVESVQNKQ